MNNIIKNLDEYNLRICINKLRGMLIERSTLNRQLYYLMLEYEDLEKKQMLENVKSA